MSVSSVQSRSARRQAGGVVTLRSVEVSESGWSALNKRVGCNVPGRLNAFLSAAVAGDDAQARSELLALLKFFPAKTARKRKGQR